MQPPEEASQRQIRPSNELVTIMSFVADQSQPKHTNEIISMSLIRVRFKADERN